MRHEELDEPKNIYYIWGYPGTGKTRWVRDHYNPDEVYDKDPTSIWWEGVDSKVHKILYIDEPSKDGLPLSTFKILCDPHNKRGIKVQMKGRVVHYNPEVIIFTSNKPPEDLYPNLSEFDREAVLRRFKYVRYCDPGTKLWEEGNIFDNLVANY